MVVVGHRLLLCDEVTVEITVGKRKGSNGTREGRVEDSLGSLMRRTVCLRVASQHPG